jgi:chromosome segregation ATPase
VRILAIAIAIVAILVALGAAGCQLGARSDAPASGAAETPDQRAIQARLGELDTKIVQLERQLGQGRGALRQGTSFTVEGAERESVIERLHRQEQELAEAKAALALKERELAALKAQLATAADRGTALASEADALSRVRDQLVTAQQELADRQFRLAQMGDQLALSELLRLRAERACFLVAAGILKLAPGQGQELAQLQEQARQLVQGLTPRAAPEPKP